MQVGDVFTFDGGTQVGIITQVYPDEACYVDAGCEIAAEDVTLPDGCVLVPHWQQVAYWEWQQGLEVTSCKHDFLQDDTLRYIGSLNFETATDTLNRHLRSVHYKKDLRNVRGWLHRAGKELKP